MVNKETFINIIEKHQLQSKRLDQLTDLGFEIWDTPVIEFGWQMFEAFIDSNFNEVDKDWIYWWLYERSDNSEIKAWDDNGKEIPMDTIEDLWNYLNRECND